MTPHPLGTRARVLLTSVFGPFAQDDEFGSRAINPMELYQNQVTREQGPFSLRMFHRSWGLLLIQHNLTAPTALLDFPTRARFIEEITSTQYDIIGISGIIVNVGKVREMCRLVRAHSPHSTIVVGGHVSAIPGVESMIDADHIVKGEGVAWFREFLGEPADAPVKHPPLLSSFGFRVMGVSPPQGAGNVAATIVTSVGCPLGCNFCTTSAFFGGKGKVVTYFQTGEDLFRVMCEAEAALGVSAFFMMDENFLLFRRRAMQLLELMRRDGKAWTLYVFSSANAIAKYTRRELVELGISWIWMGLESANSQYAKLNGADTKALVRDLQDHGIRVLGSTIVGLEHHTPENIGEELEYAVSHGTDFHQFMLYTPVPGTPLYAEMQAAGRLDPASDLADIHGQHAFNFQHVAISRDDSKRWLDFAFRRDYEVNGPSLFRLMRTSFNGWKRYHDDADPRVRARIAQEGLQLATGYAASLWAIARYLRREGSAVAAEADALVREMKQALGWRARLAAALGGPALLWTTRREARRFPNGRPMEPRTFLERRNWDAPAEAAREAPMVAAARAAARAAAL